ncbi:MAG: aminomethyl transferase family protein [Gemmatimonadetes bacterium]|nr:aminomethyl transferase family protein [Gemmatimonadota bacterium]
MNAIRPLKISGVHAVHESAGARWTEIDGWRLPDSFGDPERERQQVQRDAGIMDVSAMGKLDLKGAGVESFLAGSANNRELTTLRLKPGHALILTIPGEQPELAARFETDPAKGCLHVTDVTSGFAAFALVGPKARDILARLVAVDLRDGMLPHAATVQAGLAKVHVIIHREDWGEMPAFWLLVTRDVAEYAWDAIRAAGKDLGLVPFGLAAQQLLGGPWHTAALTAAR